MDSSTECGTKLDFSYESNPPPLIKTVSDPVIEIKKADTFTMKAFDSKWPFEDYRSRLSESEILIFENKKNSQWVKSWVIFRRYCLLDPIKFALIMYVCLCTYTLTSPQLIVFRFIYRSGAKCWYPVSSPHYTHIWDMISQLIFPKNYHGNWLLGMNGERYWMLGLGFAVKCQVFS